jgi:mRNA interferase MazF
VKPGDVVLIRFPQAELQAGKLRPALVLALAPGHHSDALLAMITSRPYQAIPGFDEIIETTDADFSSSGLKVRSIIRLSRLASIQISIINALLGEISAKRLHTLKKRVIDWLQE